MNFVALEEKGKKIFAKFPKTRRVFKKIYQRCMYTISHEDFKSEGDLIRISPDDEYEYFFGYYDKSPWDKADRHMIALRVKNAYKTPDSVEEATIVVFDTANHNSVIEIGKTHCWNSQQGCMAQWLGPDFSSKIIYNDFRNGEYCSVIYNFDRKCEEQVYKMPIYDVSKDGTFALTLDFSRLHRLRKGYGYANLPEKTRNELCPNSTCVWKLDLLTGDVTEIIKYTDLFSFETRDEMKNAEHKVNHIMISPNGKRFMLLHRWFKNHEKFTRLVTMNLDGSNMYNLSDDNFVSHCCWKNNQEILSFLEKKESGKHYYLMKDQTNQYEMMWEELNTDGHCTYSPDGKYVITDVYPNRKRIASVYLCSSKEKVRRLCRVFSPFRYDNDVRCDLHPRWNHSGNMICIDSVHDGKKGLYVMRLPFEEKVTASEKEKRNVCVVMATYNGEKYIKEQIDSLLRQKGVNVTLFIRDDGSKDHTTEILNDYQNKYENITWYQGAHLNVQKGFLDLLKNSPNADYYAFCDQDDVWDDDKLWIAVQRLEKFSKEKPAIYYCGQRLVDSNLKFLSNHYVDDKRNDYTNFLISNVAGCTAVFNKKLRDEVNSKDPDFILMHDSWVFKVCLALSGNYYVDSNAHISYRQHANNTVGLNKGIKSKLKQMKRYINDFEIQRQIKELFRLYQSEMSPEYQEYCQEIIHYDKSFFHRTDVLKKRDINFHNKGLNLTVKIKLLLKKL